jgi:predicted RNA-binding Zn ribbon-like protein
LDAEEADVSVDDEARVPDAARLVRDFINTHELQVEREDLASPADLQDWLAERDLLPDDVRLEPADLATAVTVREGLRALLLENAGHGGEAAATSALNQVLAELPLRMTFNQGGYRLVSASSSPIGQAVGELADAIRRCAEDGSWVRLKVCARDSCRWAFYDTSRNQVRRWCSMAACGNRIKMQRAYAARKNRARQEAATEA